MITQNTVNVRQNIKVKINNSLTSLDKIMAEKWQSESNGLLAGCGGISLYFMHRYLESGKSLFLDRSLEILEREILMTNEKGFEHYFSISDSSTSACWLIDQFVSLNILDSSEKLVSKEWIKMGIGSTVQEEFTSNRHDLFYGFIGKAIIAIEHDKDFAWPFVSKILKSLKDQVVHDSNRVFWKSPYPFYAVAGYEETINLGIPHGSCGIMLFLLKCGEVYHILDELEPLLKGHAEWLLYNLEKQDNKLSYFYSSKPSGTGQLGWCYGDQAIAFTLLRYSETFNDAPSKKKALEVIDQISLKLIEQSGLRYYSDYGYYDVRICHGAFGAAYMFKKMYNICKDEKLNTLANKWIDIALQNLDIYLNQYDTIVEKEKNSINIDTSLGFLNGLSGVGLALITFLDPKLSSWDKLLLLDRADREWS